MRDQPATHLCGQTPVHTHVHAPVAILAQEKPWLMPRLVDISAAPAVPQRPRRDVPGPWLRRELLPRLRRLRRCGAGGAWRQQSCRAGACFGGRRVRPRRATGPLAAARWRRRSPCARGGGDIPSHWHRHPRRRTPLPCRGGWWARGGRCRPSRRSSRGRSNRSRLSRRSRSSRRSRLCRCNLRETYHKKYHKDKFKKNQKIIRRASKKPQNNLKPI